MDKWYTVRCDYISASWVRSQDPKSWKELHPESPFMILKNKIEVNETLFVMLNLKYRVNAKDRSVAAPGVD